MKLLIVVAFTLLVQAFALPTMEDPSKPEHMPRTPEEVQWFREAIDYRFTRFQVFYDLLNDQMNRYRMSHVTSVTEVTADMMRIFAENIDYIRYSIGNVNSVVADVLAELGGTPNACLQDVMDRLAVNSATLGTAINACSRRANNTVAVGLDTVFYPTFAEIQSSASIIPVLTINALARGNVFDDPQAIIDYLESQYQVMTLQWLGAASQLFRWETNRWVIEGGFYVEEMLDCFVDPIYYYSNANAFLMFTAWDDCRP